MQVIVVISVVTVAASFLLTRPLVSVFARSDNPVYDLAIVCFDVKELFGISLICFSICHMGVFRYL